MITLSKQVAELHKLSIDEVLLLLIYENDLDLEKAHDSLIIKGFVTAKYNDDLEKIGWRVTNSGKSLLNIILVDSDKVQEPKERLEELATKLKEVFPKGKKDGTNYYWAEGVALIVRRLKLFFKKYGNTYTDEQIINAAVKYVEGFNGNYRYMRILRYFIFKEKVGAAGEIEGDSELISYIENAGHEEDLRNDWTSTIL